MEYTSAIILIVVAFAAAEPPPLRPVLSRQTSSYQPRGWRPSGPGFSLPLKEPAASYGPPTPAASYGPPPQEYGPPPAATTTETPVTTTEVEETTTIEPQAESIKSSPKSEKLQAKEGEEKQPAGLLVVLPEGQNLYYAAAPAALRVAPKGAKFVQVQGVPGFAKIQDGRPVLAKLEVPVQVQTVPFGYASSASVFTPFSQSFVQVYQ